MTAMNEKTGLDQRKKKEKGSKQKQAISDMQKGSGNAP